MYEETMREIQQASKERIELHMLAGHSRLTEGQQQRLRELDYTLPMLWDRYRREFASRSSDAGRGRPLQKAA